jgi:hypothetical protein
LLPFLLKHLRLLGSTSLKAFAAEQKEQTGDNRSEHAPRNWESSASLPTPHQASKLKPILDEADDEPYSEPSQKADKQNTEGRDNPVIIAVVEPAAAVTTIIVRVAATAIGAAVIAPVLSVHGVLVGVTEPAQTRCGHLCRINECKSPGICGWLKGLAIVHGVAR